MEAEDDTSILFIDWRPGCCFDLVACQFDLGEILAYYQPADLGGARPGVFFAN
jgi:hypothetical protein